MISRKFKNYFRNKVWIFLKATWKLRSGIDIIVANDSDWFVYNEIFANKEYDPAISLLLSADTSNPLILDLGANVGYFALKIADELTQAGIGNFRIVAIEASASNFQALKHRMSQPLLRNQVKPYLGLAGYKSGSQAVVHSQQHYGHSVIPENTMGAKNAVVDYLNIDNLINDTDKISFLKCDIEGSEEIFIKEYLTLLQKVENAVFEFHAGECNVDHCRQMLSEVGLFSKGIIKEDSVYKTSVEIFSRSKRMDKN
jgi:FkbM family methyltransferase